MNRYRIAFFTADWNYDLVESTLHGLKQFVDDHEDVNLCIFDCFGKDVNNARDHSEYAIFDLVDLDQFDGLLIQGNQIVLEPVRDAIANRVAQSGIPALSIDCPIEGCAVLGIDNRQAQQDIVRHLIDEHGARRLVYLTGILDNGSPEAHQRLEGFRDACNEAGLDPKDIEVIRCTWRTSDGLRVAERWHRDRLPLPDAFVCGNDEMALGLIEGLQKHGIRVPDDVRVTGFDNITSAELSRPRLSTISRDYSAMNYSAMECLLNRIKGLDKRDFIPFEYGVIHSESCGCGAGEQPDLFRDKYFQQTRTLKAFFVQQEQLAAEMFDASDLAELMDIGRGDVRRLRPGGAHGHRGAQPGHIRLRQHLPVHQRLLLRQLRQEAVAQRFRALRPGDDTGRLRRRRDAGRGPRLRPLSHPLFAARQDHGRPAVPDLLPAALQHLFHRLSGDERHQPGRQAEPAREHIQLFGDRH